VSLVYSSTKSKLQEVKRTADVKRESDRRGRLSHEDCVNRGHEFARERYGNYHSYFVLLLGSRYLNGYHAATKTSVRRPHCVALRFLSRWLHESSSSRRFSRVRAYPLSRFPSVLICPSFSFFLPLCLSSSVFRLSWSTICKVLAADPPRGNSRVSRFICKTSARGFSDFCGNFRGNFREPYREWAARSCRSQSPKSNGEKSHPSSDSR